LHFHLSKIGQITSADIETKNLTLFIGKNGSGKTYATSSIWSLINFVKETAPKKEVIRCPQFDKWKEELSKIAEKGGSAHFDFGLDNQRDVEITVLDLFHKNRKDILAEAIGYDGFGASRVTCSNENRNDELSVLCRVEKVTHRIEQDDDEWEHDFDQDESTEGPYFEDAYSVYVEYNLNGKKFYNSSSEDVPEDLIADVVESEVTKFLIGFSCFGRDWKYLFGRPSQDVEHWYYFSSWCRNNFIGNIQRM